MRARELTLYLVRRTTGERLTEYTSGSTVELTLGVKVADEPATKDMRVGELALPLAGCCIGWVSWIGAGELLLGLYM